MEIKREYFNEVFEPEGRVRERYRPLFEALERIGEEEFAARCARAGEKLRELGATFPLPDDPEGQDRILPADPVPSSEKGRGCLPFVLNGPARERI